MKNFLIGIILCSSLFAATGDVVEGYGAAAAFMINQKMNVTTMSQDERTQACKNIIKASGIDQNRPFLENYNQAMSIAVIACLKDLK